MKHLLPCITLTLLLTGCASAAATPASDTTLADLPTAVTPSATMTGLAGLATPSVTPVATSKPNTVPVSYSPPGPNSKPKPKTKSNPAPSNQQPTQPAPTQAVTASQQPAPTQTPTPAPTQAPASGATPTPTPMADATSTPAPAPTPAPSSGDKNCSDFKTQKEAQDYFNSKGGSASNNVDGLDADHDGIACESLP